MTTSADKTSKNIYPITAKDSKVYNVVDKGKLKITKVAIDSQERDKIVAILGH